MVVLKDEGDKIVQGLDLHVFVKGAYNLGPVIEPRQVSSANVHPGLGVIHATGAGGEDDYTEHGNDSALSYAVAELDENQIELCSAVYGQYDNIPGIPYHMNPGAYLRNIKIADPAANVEPDTRRLVSSSRRLPTVRSPVVRIASTRASVNLPNPGFTSSRKPRNSEERFSNPVTRSSMAD